MIKAILFDKDGTLTDFRATWEASMPATIRALASETGASADRLAEVIGIDLASGRILPDAAFVTATGAQNSAALASVTGWSAPRHETWWRSRSAGVAQVPVTDLGPYLAALAARGFVLGVLTNADEAEARAHLAHLGALPHLARVIGCDSGYGAKPDPRGAAAFADDLGLARDEVVLAGDGMTDMLAARGAGLQFVAVTTGTLDTPALAPHADAVLRDIRDLPGWLASSGR